jgi:hypothetical protein
VAAIFILGNNLSQNLPVTEYAGALRLLRDVVADLTHDNYVPTAAAVKSEMLKRSDNFDEGSLGFKRFVLFLESAVESGQVGLIRDARNHPRVFPSAIAPDKVQAAIDLPSELSRGDRKLRREVWRAFVNWQPAGYWRGWDREERQIFMAPPSPSALAPWQQDPERYVEISTVTLAMQLEWMHEFATEHPSPAREALLESLAPDVKDGSFKQALTSQGLATAWADALRARVGKHVGTWAQERAIRISLLVERPANTQPAPIATSRGDDATLRPAPLQSDRTEANSLHTAGSDELASADRFLSVEDEAERLRVRLRAVLDHMDLDQLRAISIPAAFLLEL